MEILRNIPRAEHPRPDAIRECWLNLNGEWEFEVDNAVVGLDKHYERRAALDEKITVPFSPESALSGLGYTDFMNAVCYRRTFTLPAGFADKRTFLHFGACDYETTVFVNEKKVGTHKGGYTSFSFDITDALTEGENVLFVYAFDDVRSGLQFAGKQSPAFTPSGCLYTRTTGIWQTVWLEARAAAHVSSYRAFPNIHTPSVGLQVLVSPASLGGTLTVTASYEGKVMGKACSVIASTAVSVDIVLAEAHLWEPGEGRLYDLAFTVEKDGARDEMQGYFGLREVALTKEKGLQINGKTVFGRFVLDQGYYPDGIITAPSDEELVRDIEVSMACGFNGARLHQKVFEVRYLYHADRLGYMVWGEAGNWGFDYTTFDNLQNFLPEWLEEVERDFSHPSIIGWCPFNETWDKNGKDYRGHSNALIDLVYDATKAMDKTRPVVANSGSLPTNRTDVHDVHDYEQDPAVFRTHYERLAEGECLDTLARRYPTRQVTKSYLPVFVSEYGGIGWVMSDDETAWGYGESVKTEEEYFARLEGLTDALLENEQIFALCYTQLTDVEHEQNGIMTYDRRMKFPAEKYRRIFSKKAAIEK